MYKCLRIPPLSIVQTYGRLPISMCAFSGKPLYSNFCNHVSDKCPANLPTASDSAAFLFACIYIPPCWKHASDKLPAHLPTTFDSAACLLACILIYFPFAGVILLTSFWQTFQQTPTLQNFFSYAFISPLLESCFRQSSGKPSDSF